MTTTNNTSLQTVPEAQAVADIVRKHIAPHVVELTDGELSTKVLVLPNGHGLTAHSVREFLDEVRQRPERREGTAKLVELASFIDHVNRFKDADSAIFAVPDPKKPELAAVLDYHRAGTGDPRFGRHRALYTFPISDEWKAWTGANGNPMDQATFAGWLEDRIIDVADPGAAFSSAKKFAEALNIPSFASPAKLLSLSRGLSVNVEEKATNRIDPATGETTIFFSAEHKDDGGAPLAVPRAFLVQIPVFRGGTAYQLAVRLKYRVGGGRIAWSYEMHAADKALDDAFREACELAQEKTSLPLFYGTPEA